MEKTILNIKTDKKLKAAAQDTAKELGVPLSTAINAFLRQFVRDKELHLSAAPRVTSHLEAVVREARAEYQAGKSIGPFTSAAEDAEKVRKIS